MNERGRGASRWDSRGLYISTTYGHSLGLRSVPAGGPRRVALEAVRSSVGHRPASFQSILTYSTETIVYLYDAFLKMEQAMQNT